MELSDLNRIKQQKLIENSVGDSTIADQHQFTLSINNDEYMQINENTLKNRKVPVNEKDAKHLNKDKYKNFNIGRNSSFLTHKSLQLLYFWARTRIVQRAIMLLCLFWFILIFYKSLLVVELLRYDVNISKETVDALLPKYGFGIAYTFMTQIKNGFYQFVSPLTSEDLTTVATMSTTTTTNPFLSRKYGEFNSISDINTNFNNNLHDFFNSTISDDNRIKRLNTYNSLFFNNENWKRLSYSHWLNLFSNYNISLYKR